MKRNLFSVSQTFSETTPESVEAGDYSNTGWEFKPTFDFSLADLLYEIKSQGVEHVQHLPEQISIYGPWVVQSYQTGEEKQNCLHIRATPRVIKRILKIIKKGE
jgi:hypothetical protein